jgi:hypothetical protein
MSGSVDRLVADALLAGSEHEHHLLRAAQLQSERARCTVVALTAVGVDLGNRVPKTWAACLTELASAVGATGFERLEVTSPHDVTPTGRRRLTTYRSFVRDHPTGVYLLLNTGHCTALVDGVFVDSEGHGPDTRRVQKAVRLLERPGSDDYRVVAAYHDNCPTPGQRHPLEEPCPRSSQRERPVPKFLKDTCALAAEILDGAHDADLDYIQQAVQERRKNTFRPGLRVRLHGTRDPELDGQVGTVVKVNPKRVTVGLGERDQFGYPREFNVPAAMLELV